MKNKTRMSHWLCMAFAMFAAFALWATDFTVPAGDPKVMTPADSAECYDQVTVNDNLTLNGADCGLTNSADMTIGETANHPVAVVVTNGAMWVSQNRIMYFRGNGGTITVSAPEGSLPDFNSWGATVSLPWGNPYKNTLATVGYNTHVQIENNLVDYYGNGIMDLARLLPNGTVSFRQIFNRSISIAVRVLFEGGLIWVQNNANTRFHVENGSRIILESVDSNPIYIRSLAQSFSLFTGNGTLETKGDGDFILYHNYTTDSSRMITIGDASGKIVWGHKGQTILGGRAIWKIGADDALPYGSLVGSVVISNDHKTTNGNVLDLNGKKVMVNGLTYAGENGSNRYYCYVTNSSVQVARLALYVDTGDTMTIPDNFANFAANASSSIRLGKGGDGILNVNTAMPTFAGWDVLGGTFISTANVTGGSLFATNGATLMVKAPYCYGTSAEHKQGFDMGYIDVEAGDGATVLSNVWQRALKVRSGAARIENGAVNALASERLWRPVKSQIGAVAVEGGTLDIVRGCLSATNISVAADATLRLRGGAGMANRVDFYTPELSDSYYRFIFKESENKKSYALNHLYLLASDRTREFSVASGETSQYTLNTTASSATALAAGEYMYSCPGGVSFVEATRSGCEYSASGLSSRIGWGGVIINENKGLSLSDPDTWVTLTIRRRAGASSPLVGYVMSKDWTVDDLEVWEVQASPDGVTWRTVDSRSRADIYSYTHATSSDPEKDGYGTFNGGEYFSWRSAAPDNAFSCAGSVQVDDGAILDLSGVPSANVSIGKLTLDVASGGGTIKNFRPAANGTLDITGSSGRLLGTYKTPLKLPDAVNAENLSSWTVTVDGVVSQGSVACLAEGFLCVKTPRGIVVSFR